MMPQCILTVDVHLVIFLSLNIQISQKINRLSMQFLVEIVLKTITICRKRGKDKTRKNLLFFCFVLFFLHNIFMDFSSNLYVFSNDIILLYHLYTFRISTSQTNSNVGFQIFRQTRSFFSKMAPFIGIAL